MFSFFYQVIGFPTLFVLEKLFLVFKELGLTIFFFTVLIKILILPLTLKQLSFFEKIQKISPQIKEIEKKYRGKGINNPEKIKEIVALYQKEKLNPYLSYILLFLQIFILGSVYWAIQIFNTKKKGQLLFLIWDATKPNFLFPALIIFFQILNTPQKDQLKLSFFLSFLFFFIFSNLPAGVSFYFLSFQVLSFFEMLLFNQYQKRCFTKTQ
ncbi:YidC/Oxa1 family membrane protein insertase, partial [Candidatus Parcubacteria bacterium]|nr:YidC/Oxa1 family membrane protein insertase [Candidatus Parcubacteria bacterium]